MGERVLLNRWQSTAAKLKALDDRTFINVASLALNRDPSDVVRCDREKISDVISPFMSDFIAHPCYNTDEDALDGTPMKELPDYEKYSVMLNGHKFCYLVTDLFLWMNQPGVTLDPYRRFNFDDIVTCGLSHRAVIQLRVALLSNVDVLANLVHEEETFTPTRYDWNADITLDESLVVAIAQRAGINKRQIQFHWPRIMSICHRLYGIFREEILRHFNILHPQNMQLVINTKLLGRAFALVNAGDYLVGFNDTLPQDRPDFKSAIALQSTLYDYATTSGRLVLSDQAISLFDYGFASMLHHMFSLAATKCRDARTFVECFVNITDDYLPVRFQLRPSVRSAYYHREGDDGEYLPDVSDEDTDEDDLIDDHIDDVEALLQDLRL